MPSWETMLFPLQGSAKLILKQNKFLTIQNSAHHLLMTRKYSQKTGLLICHSGLLHRFVYWKNEANKIS